MGIDEGVWSYRLRPTLLPPRRPLSSNSSLTHQLGAGVRQLVAKNN